MKGHKPRPFFWIYRINTIEVFTAAMLEGWNKETILHENRSYFPGEKMYCFCPPTWRQWWKCSIQDGGKQFKMAANNSRWQRTVQDGGNDVTWKYSIRQTMWWTAGGAWDWSYIVRTLPKILLKKNVLCFCILLFFGILREYIITVEFLNFTSGKKKKYVFISCWFFFLTFGLPAILDLTRARRGWLTSEL